MAGARHRGGGAHRGLVDQAVEAERARHVELAAVQASLDEALAGVEDAAHQLALVVLVSGVLAKLRGGGELELMARALVAAAGPELVDEQVERDVESVGRGGADGVVVPSRRMIADREDQR